ncbi:hypothetical protein ABXT43_00850 [Candidatus Pelagibacter sp. Uisw_114]
MLEKNGKFFGYVPFLYNYHAPKDLKFYDFYRFSKDGVSYLLKDFSEIEIFPVRGKISTLGNMLMGGYWKNFLEKFSIHILIDKILNDKSIPPKQVVFILLQKNNFMKLKVLFIF